MSEKPIKTLGQVAHEKGEEIGAWERRWDRMPIHQRDDWEQIAKAVIDYHFKRMAALARKEFGI